ncbi:penicillin-binding transpeptidase domain-containing protein [Flexithrix dorotheae]|uniref:penicillin-binding transpeptidase domain-containing protein n=1 Tax=Flexithrix dorotheae TaxID=70993 RepID=UPI000363EA1C|nr:penicillin-binding transpeptidase domain-containing protein [Flexithrix dorotheae]
MEERKIFIGSFFVFFAVVYLVKLLQIQVFDVNYQRKAENNIIDKITEYPSRGMILDRNGEIIVRNRPVFDLMVIPKELKIKDTTAFCEFFNIDLEFAREKLLQAKKYSQVQPSIFLKQLSTEDFARIQDRLADYPGIYTSERTIRDYPGRSLANSVGYVKEVDKKFLESEEGKGYRQGDLVGKSGLERYYEKQLRGKRGVSYVVRNVKGVKKGKFHDGEFDTLPQIGSNLITGIDLELQQYGEKLMVNKKGAVIAVDPATGEILTIISAPDYDPNLLTGEGKKSSQNFVDLARDPNKPLFNRAIQATYPPGSTFKTVMALVGLHDHALDSSTTYFSCDKSLVGCHGHPSPLNVYGSIQHSCNPFYFKALRKIINQGRSNDEREDTRIGLEAWKDQMLQFGLGKKLGVDLPFESRGIIPSPEYYDKNYYIKNWRLSNVYSIGIGQGEVLLTPLQLANQAACIANQGWYIPPHLVKAIGDSVLTFEKQKINIEKEYFDYVSRAMGNIYTASMSKIPGLTVCGKTGTAQNPHGEDHSVFMAFSPRVNPKIAIAVYVENAGFGGSWAAPVASLMIEKYINKEISQGRKWIETRVLNGNFMDVQ